MKKKLLMMRTKSLGGILLAFLMVLGLTACGQPSEGAAVDTAEVAAEEETDAVEGSVSAADESITVSVMGMRHPIQGEWSTLEFFRYMEEKTGISLEFDTPAADVFEEKKALAIASESYPDVFFGALLNTSQQIQWGMDEKMLIPLNDLIEEYAPNVSAMFDAIPGLKASVTAPDGNIYALPQVNEAPIAYMASGYYNGAWLEALSVTREDLPTTLDGFYDLLVRFRDEDPNGNGKVDEIPLMLMGNALTGGDIPEYYILPTFDINSTRHYVDDDVVKYGAQQENYKEYLKFMRKLYDEKLLDNSFATSDSTISTAAAKANTVGLIMTAGPQNAYDVDTEGAATYYNLGALSSDYTNGEQRYAYPGSPFTQGTFAITDKCQNPEAMMSWVDYLYSEEGSIYVHYGPEGELWSFTESGLRSYNDVGMPAEEYRGGKITPDCGTPCPKWVRAETEGSWEDAFQPIRIENVDLYQVPYAKQAFPSTYFSVEQTDRITELSTDINKYINEMVAGFVVGTYDVDAKWDEFQATLTQMGVEELVEIYQESYDNWLAANK